MGGGSGVESSARGQFMLDSPPPHSQSIEMSPSSGAARGKTIQGEEIAQDTGQDDRPSKNWLVISVVKK